MALAIFVSVLQTASSFRSRLADLFYSRIAFAGRGSFCWTCIGSHRWRIHERLVRSVDMARTTCSRPHWKRPKRLADSCHFDPSSFSSGCSAFSVDCVLFSLSSRSRESRPPVPASACRRRVLTVRLTRDASSLSPTSGKPTLLSFSLRRLSA